MNKLEIVELILLKLREQFEARLKSSRVTREGGNHEESRAESKYDTLYIEENYLADGLARQALAAAQAIEAIEAIPNRDFARDEPIGLGALVEVEFSAGREWFFLAPAGGGTEIEYRDCPVTVLTPESPLGLKLIGSLPGSLIDAPSCKILRVL